MFDFIFSHFLFVMFAGFLVIPALVIVVFFTSRRRWQKRPTAPGLVISSEVVATQRSDKDYGSKPEPCYMARIRYRYTVAGKEYESDTRTNAEIGPDSGIIRAGVDFPREIYAQRVADRYPQGARIVVHYNPEKPSESVLDV
ncbi:MAG: DUF3592 domain-containing protein [Alphaproteobacteria bacterium]|nr:DUF3592 domain-containing protein [Alphaproteobacteria bacterium]